MRGEVHYALDPVDEQLVKLLSDDARISSEVVAKQLDISPSTARRRLRKLVEDGILRIGALIDPYRCGYPVIAMIAIRLAHENLESASDMLTANQEIRWVSTTTGQFDIMAIGTFRSTADLGRFIEGRLAQIKGLKETQSFVCLNVKKGQYVQP